MKRIIKLKESDLEKIIGKILKEQDDEWVKITPERFLELLKYTSNNTKVLTKLPEFRGKKIWIDGDLNVSKLGKDITSLDGVSYVNGKLDISNTDIASVSGIEIKGHLQDWGSKKNKIEIKRAKDKMLADAKERREEGEWDLDNPNLDDVGMYANAVITYIERSDRVMVKNKEDIQREKDLYSHMEQLLEKEKQYEEEGRDLTDIHAEIEATEDEINTLSDGMDVYDIVEKKYNHYRMKVFEVFNGDLANNEYAVGTESEIEDSAKQAAEQMLDDGYGNFNKSFLESHIDEEQVMEVLREYYEDMVREEPDSYFDSDDFALTDEQEREIETYKNQIEELEERQNDLESEIEDPEEYSKMYDDIQDQIDDLQNHIDRMEPDNEPTEDMIEDKVDELVRSRRGDALDVINEWGLNIENFIDRDGLIEDIVNTDGYGYVLGSYDGSYDVVRVNGEELYVIRIN